MYKNHAGSIFSVMSSSVYQPFYSFFCFSVQNIMHTQLADDDSLHICLSEVTFDKVSVCEPASLMNHLVCVR